MEASVGEPFLLSSHTASKKTSKPPRSSKTLPPVFASHHRARGSSEGCITVAAQGDGVHVSDLSTLHPIISHTLGPTTTFSCPSVTHSQSQGVNHICTTYAAISSSPDISENEQNRTIWMWKEDLSSSVVDRAAQKKKTVALPHQISGMYIDEEQRLVVTSQEGDVTVLRGDLQVRATYALQSEVVKTYVFSTKNCTFAKPGPSTTTIIVSIVSSDSNVRIRILALDSEDQFHELGNIELPVQAKAISDVSFNETGFFSVLLKDGTWSSYELKPTDDSIYLKTLENTQLTSLSFLVSSNNSEISITSLGSSHVLLAGLSGSGSKKEVALLVWDLSFSVLLASRTFPLPPNLPGDHVSITLVGALSSSNVLLILSPTLPPSERRQSQDHSSSASSSIWVVPVTVPPKSSLANALGRAAATSKWLASSDVPDDMQDVERTKVLTEMRTAIERNLPENADNAFLEWDKRTFSEETSSKDKLPDSVPVYGYNFTKEVLHIVTQPANPRKIVYSNKIVQHLLEKKAISTGMIDAGILPVLLRRNDWNSISLALTRVPDLREVEIVECLCFVLARHRHALRTTSLDAMQVDTTPDLNDSTPSLLTFFNLILRYNFSPIPLRAALRRYLSDIDDVVCLLEVLDNWIGQWAGRDARLLPSNKALKKNELGIYVTKPEGKDSQTDIPTMLQITIFLQCLIDTSFLNLIQTPSTYRILKRIQSHIDPEIRYIDQTEQLRGPLELFARAQAKAIKEAKAAKEGIQISPSERRQRKKLLHEQAGAAIGLYQLEELTL
ncbi:hypothetical protein EV360DRAFT_47995 [Lentinula raphanica]|nr:hypothetical protein EV360DRAFT_47995 [Lentinula raphanica]